MSDTQQVPVTELVIGDEVLEGGFMVGGNDYSRVIGTEHLDGGVRITWPGYNTSTFGLGHKCTIKKRPPARNRVYSYLEHNQPVTTLEVNESGEVNGSGFDRIVVNATGVTIVGIRE